MLVDPFIYLCNSFSALLNFSQALSCRRVTFDFGLSDHCAEQSPKVVRVHCEQDQGLEVSRLCGVDCWKHQLRALNS